MGETAAAAGMTAKTLRFYENRGLLPDASRAANLPGLFRESVDRLKFTRRDRNAGRRSLKSAASSLSGLVDRHRASM
jgi:DNA-binding transcriptional MerR regulator